MKLRIPIPIEMSHLKIDEHGYPIPFFVPIINDKPDFKFLDEKKRNIAIEKKLCAICGKKLCKDFSYIISGPIGYKNRIGTDGPMHQACAEFAIMVCPHLYFEKAERKEVENAASYHTMEKPAELFIVKISKFKTKPSGIDHHNLVHYKPVSHRKFIYVNGELQEE